MALRLRLLAACVLSASAALAWTPAAPARRPPCARLAVRSSLVDIRLAAKKGGKGKRKPAAAGIGGGSPVAAPPPAAMIEPPAPAARPPPVATFEPTGGSGGSPLAATPPPAAPPSAAAFVPATAATAADWGDREVTSASEPEVGVLILQTYEDWQAKQAVETKPAAASARRRRGVGGAVVEDETASAAGAEEAGDEAGDDELDVTPSAAWRRRERRLDEAAEAAAAETAAAEARVTAGAWDGLSAGLAERERRRQLLLLDPRADVYAPPTPLRPGGPVAPQQQMASEDYDYFSAILGEGARTDYGNFFLGPYLQSGHLVLTPTVFLAAYVSDPNFPLTSLPVEYRDFVKVAIAITYAINAGIAVYAALIAAPARGLPAPFWAIKCFLLGGVALGELTSVPLKTEKKK